MSLKFICPNCGIEIVAKYLRPGDKLICRECKYEIIVPADSAPTDDDSNILKRLKAESSEIKSYHYNNEIDEEKSEEEPKEPTPWGVFSIIKFLIALLGLIFISSCLIGFISAIVVKSTNPGATTQKELLQDQISDIAGSIMSFAIYIFSVAIIYYSVVKRHHQDFFRGLHIFAVTRQQVIKFVKIAAGAVFSVGALVVVISFTPIQNYIPEHIPLDKYIGNTFGKLIIFTVIALMAPFVEEIIFRGYFYKGFENRMGSKWAGTIVTILFVAVHGPQLAFSPILMSFIAIIAIILIYIRIKTDNLTNCIIVHLIYNSILVVAMWTVFLTVGFGAGA